MSNAFPSAFNWASFSHPAPHPHPTRSSNSLYSKTAAHLLGKPGLAETAPQASSAWLSRLDTLAEH